MREETSESDHVVHCGQDLENPFEYSDLLIDSLRQEIKSERYNING